MINIDFIDQNDPLIKRYKDLLRLFDCSQVMNIPTRITATTASALDHIITNSKEKLCQYGTLNVGLSDHLITYCTRKVWRCQINRHNTVHIRSMRHYSKESLLKKLADINWEEILACNDINNAWCKFKFLFLNIIDEISPVKEVRIKCRTEPWMNDNIFLDIRQRDRYLRLYKKNRNKEMYSEYCKLRNKVQRDVKKAKAEYFRNKIEENKGNPKKLWQTLKSNRQEVSNYRPISILPTPFKQYYVISKIIEKLNAVFEQLHDYLNEAKVITDFQSGFRGNYSTDTTDTALIHLTDYIRSETSKGNFMGMVLLDIQKAFDTVNHQILLEKLLYMGVASDSLKWFRSYLSERKQVTSINRVQSQPCTISSGVPQGSILGPLLFICYMNDIPISVNCKFMLYADDTVLLSSGKDTRKIANELSKNLESCNTWLVNNKLALHPDKTESILFGTKRKLKKVDDFNVTCMNKSLCRKQSIKYLGCLLDDDLSGESMVQQILNKTSSRLKFLYRHAACLDFHSRKNSKFCSHYLSY